MDKVFDNNKVSICGEIVSGFTYSHDVFGEGFYLFDLKVNRLSDAADVIPVMISERIINVDNIYVGKIARISGQFRSYNRHDSGRSRLVLSVFAREVNFIDEVYCDENDIFLDGFVCKPPIYRKTPLGREIADVLLAVNRPYGKSDYIPCILWGRNARYISDFEPGKHLKVWGRIQSREYQKRIADDEFEKRVAYEVSVCKVEEVTKDGN